MVTIVRARQEARARDKKRQRFLLRIGDITFHLSADEARSMKRRLNRYKTL